MTLRLQDLDDCFHGVIPGTIATCDRAGIPNISYVSYVEYLDETHVALSCQFFNKTRQNLDVNPRATLQVYDPLTFQAYELRLRFDHDELSGPLFDAMAVRIQAIASHTGMSGVFKLRSADVFEVLSFEPIERFLEPTAADVPYHGPARADAPLTELRGLQVVSERINRAGDLDALLREALAALADVFGFRYGMILSAHDAGPLVMLASNGYGDACIGAEVHVGQGLIGTVAAQRRLLRLGSVEADLRYGRAIRARVEQESGAGGLTPEIPLPGLTDARSQMAIPLVARDRLLGVLALECPDTMTFAAWHEQFLQIVANQIAFAIDRMLERDAEPDAADETPVAAAPAPPAAAGPLRKFTLFRNDDCVFVDGEYLIRNVPAKILWKLLREFQDQGRVDFSNRELRLDPSLGLPPIKDNLESRLILLRKRLEQKCPELRLVPTRRGRFALEVGCQVQLLERETA